MILLKPCLSRFDDLHQARTAAGARQHYQLSFTKAAKEVIWGGGGCVEGSTGGPGSFENHGGGGKDSGSGGGEDENGKGKKNGAASRTEAPLRILVMMVILGLILIH